MILINAANGQQGKLLVPKLLTAGAEVRACVRSEQSATELRTAGVADVLVGEISDPALIKRAVNGVKSIYHVCPGIQPLERQIGFGWIDAAKAAGVEHFIFSSVLHPILDDLVQHEIKRTIEEHLIVSGLEFTILQPSIYMAPRRFRPALEMGELKVGWSLDRLQSLVDIGDVTDVAAAVLLNGNTHKGATYELAGAGRYTAHDMAAAMATVLGKPVSVREVDAEAYLAGLFGQRDFNEIPHEVSVARSLRSSYSAHDFIGNPNVLTWLLGRSPTTFEQFLTSLNAARTPS